ncbi:hypothetical protein D9757_012187 [Collybiopsis confluens]|uniref:Glucose-methanol-choline oxidoreductase N-terminal domain-containing protein n=1 Tax=Collybiopsis confluens TaxID=2823264 RepID=A0A8H5LR76_9AGAR|nr:hypothetical protein D9757_012187 [Collybiopsis confluens]
MLKAVNSPLLQLLSFTIWTFARATVITNDTSSLAGRSFEFIIAGGGTTALAVANRLAVDHTVLVVERGQDFMNNEVINDPYTPGATPNPCKFQINLAPQLGSNGTRNLQMNYGSCLGGGSSVNTMIGSRPTFAGMSAVEALGNPGWGWNEFLSYMQKSETFDPPDPTQRAEGADYIEVVHGFNGPVGVSFAHPLSAPELQAAAKATTNKVFNGSVALSPDMGTDFREDIMRLTTITSTSTNRLTVLTGHLVDTVLTSPAGGNNITATGVRVVPRAGGTASTFHASREIVLSAGTFYSPAILQRSGIGNATFLQNLGIKPVLNLPAVGTNFQDQILLTNVTFPVSPAANITNVTGGNHVLLAVVVTHPTAIDTLGLSGAATLDNSLRNISAERALSAGGVINAKSFTTQAEVLADAYQIDHPLIEIFYTPGSTSINVWAQSATPISRGTIRINTTDPTVDPITDPQYLVEEADIQVAVAAARRVSSIAVTPPFSDLLTPTALADSGTPAVGASDEVVRSWVLQTYTAGTHPIGSNPMMPRELGGVVSPELLVYGTTNIRVADASIVPLSVFPHTTLGLYGVAEKAADMILQAVEA